MSASWRAFYEKTAECCPRYRLDEDPSERLRVYVALQLIPANLGSFLDVGCGDGALCQELGAARLKPFVGCDIASRRLEYARRKVRAEFIQAEASRLPFRDRSFDIVSLVEVVEHLDDPLQALREAARCSRRYVVITVPYREVLTTLVCPKCLAEYKLNGHLQSFDEARLSQFVAKAEMAVVALRGFVEPLPRDWRGHPVGSAVNTVREKLLYPRRRHYKYLGALCQRRDVLR